MIDPAIERILSFPPGTWSPQEQEQVRESRRALHSQMFALADEAERAERNLTADEAARFAEMQAAYERLTA